MTPTNGRACTPAARSSRPPWPSPRGRGRTGARFIRSVVAGYDIGCRMTQALGVQNVRSRALSLHGIGTNFGAAAAAASILGLKEESVRFVWDYSCQQDSGKYYWMRDRDHVEKAFVFAAMGARNGVTSALLVQSGFTGVDDAFSGENNYFESFGPGVIPGSSLRSLAAATRSSTPTSRNTSVGAPIQAPLDALLILRERHGLTAADVEAMTARVPDDRVLSSGIREMPDVDLRHVLAVALLDGGMTFEASHSYERMKDPAVLAIARGSPWSGDPELRTAKIKRGGIVEITTRDGAQAQGACRTGPRPAGESHVGRGDRTEMHGPDAAGSRREADGVPDRADLEPGTGRGRARVLAPCSPPEPVTGRSRSGVFISTLKSAAPLTYPQVLPGVDTLSAPFFLPGDFSPTPQCSSGALYP